MMCHSIILTSNAQEAVTLPLSNPQQCGVGLPKKRLVGVWVVAVVVVSVVGWLVLGCAKHKIDRYVERSAQQDRN
eukprot:scaffold4844_cov96-Skeletonema_marinoi.AAC.1